MSLLWLLAVVGLLPFGPPGATTAGRPHPRVQVVADVRGEIFDTIPTSDLAKLKRDVQDQVRKAAPKIVPCVEWITAQEGQSVPGARARLLVYLTQRSYGNFWRIDLSFYGVVGKDEPLQFWAVDTGLSPLVWHPRNRAEWEKLRQQLFKTIDAQFSDPTQEFRRALDSKFLVYIQPLHPPGTPSAREEPAGPGSE
jgi:hypothetical protein